MKRAEEWIDEGWSSIPVEKRSAHVRAIQADAMREAAWVVESGNAYRHDADPLFEAGKQLREMSDRILKGGRP